MGVAYCASSSQGLNVIEPSYNQHFKDEAVFASEDEDAAALSLGRLLGDYTCWPSSNGHITINEHFKGAFNLRFGSEKGQRKGSIYILDSGMFYRVPMIWDKEIISMHPVTPANEAQVDDVYKYINDLLDDGTVELKIAEKEFEELPNYKHIIMDAIRIDEYREDMKKYNPSTFERWLRMIG